MASLEHGIFPIQVLAPLVTRVVTQLTIDVNYSIISQSLEDVILQEIINQVLASISSSISLALSTSDLSILNLVPGSYIVVINAHSSIILIGTVRPTLVDSQVHTYSTVCASLATLGSDKYYTVTCRSTIQRSRSSILQYCQALNIGRVNITDISIEHSTIHYIKRSVRSIHGTETTDTDACTVTRLTSSSSNLHTRGITLQCIGSVRNGTFLQCLCTYRRCGTGERRLLCSTISYYNDIFQYLSIALQHDSHISSDSQLFCLHTYV